MTLQSSTRVSLLCASFLTAACGVDRATAPDAGAALSAAIASGTPTSVSAWPASNVEITLSWSDNSRNETGFEVHRSTTGTNGPFTRLSTVGANVTSFSDRGGAPLTEYCYKVRSVRAHGNKSDYSDFSDVACATTYGPPAAPSGVTATPLWWGEITVAWTAAPTATGYRVQRSATGADPWGLIATIGETSYRDGSRPIDEESCYRIVAYNSWGDSPPSSTKCTAVPASPSNLVSTVGAAGGIDLAWSDNSRAEDGYEVQRSGSDFVFAAIGSVPANTVSYHDALATPGHYWYRVRAKRDAGYSYFSNDASAVIATAPPTAPRNVRAIPAGSTAASVYWEDMSDDEQGFRVERSTNGRVTWLTAGTTGYNQQGFTDVGRVAEQEVCYRVIAFNNTGDSPASNEDCTAPPAPPSGLVATAVGSDAIELSWSRNPGVADGYEIRRWACYEDWYSGQWYCDYYAIATVGRDVNSYSDMWLNPSESYSYRVFAFKLNADLVGYSDPSNEASATTGATPE